jgi:hypothetical protein
LNFQFAYKSVLALLLAVPVSTFAQQKTIPLNRLRQIEIDMQRSNPDTISQQGIKPYLESRIDLEHTFGYEKDTSKYYYKASVKLFRDNLFIVDQPGFYVTIDPLLDVGLGHDYSDVTELQDTALIYSNTRGARMAGDIGKRVSFESSIYENQTRFPAYMTNYVNAHQVVPGQGRIKPFKNGAFDYSSSYGWVSVTPIDQLNLQVGHGKNFIGHGYRSMLLSDNTSNYPFMKAQYTGFDNKLQYTWIYAGLQTLERLPLGEVPESLFKRKSASFYYLSYSPHPMIEVGLFEGMVWQRWDTTGTLPLQGEMFIPVIGVNSGLFGLNNVNNSVLGLNIRINPLQGTVIYGQVLTDDFSKKMAYQVGIKQFNFLLRNLHLQAEYNRATAETYGATQAFQSYTHMNQSLAHPVGSEFEEVVGILNYRYKRWYTQIKAHMIRHEESQLGEPAEYVEHTGLLGISQTNIIDAQLGIYVNPKTSLNVALGYMHRYWKIAEIDHRTDWFYLTIRTSLFNKYYDF